MSREVSDSMISVVMPLLNEVAVIRQVVRQAIDMISETGCACEVVLVNDGSTDGSREVLDEMAAADTRISVIHLSRNFGHQAAVHAGLCHATGNAVILMDSDAQDDPTALASMIERWQEGYDVVYAVRHSRKENILKRAAFSSFHRLMSSMSSIPIPRDAGNFGLLDARVVKQIVDLGETDRYFPGLRTWVGFRQCALPVERLKRHDDQPRVSFRGLVSLAKTAMFSFSRIPLLAFYGLAVVSALLGMICIGWAIYHKLVTGEAIPGWTSITIVSAFFGSLNALGIAILGEYVTRIYDQVRNRPAFVIDETRNINFKRRRSDIFPGNPSTTKAGLKTDGSLLEEVQALRDEVQLLTVAQSSSAIFPQAGDSVHIPVVISER
jgi:dolichol-phosphate mannosyltransferase